MNNIVKKIYNKKYISHIRNFKSLRRIKQAWKSIFKLKGELLKVIKVIEKLINPENF